MTESGLLISGANEFTTYLISGKLVDVQAHMRALYLAGVTY
ncbi:MAG TPA: hypothetical protein VIU34_07530 [Steroidobacter sp.]